MGAQHMVATTGRRGCPTAITEKRAYLRLRRCCHSLHKGTKHQLTREPTKADVSACRASCLQSCCSSSALHPAQES